MKFHFWLKAFRDKQGKTQVQFAELMQVSTRSYQSFEYGTAFPSIKELYLLKQAYGDAVNIDQWLTEPLK